MLVIELSGFTRLSASQVRMYLSAALVSVDNITFSRQLENPLVQYLPIVQHLPVLKSTFSTFTEMDNLDNLPDGIAARLRALEDEEDDEVDHSIPTTWGVNNSSDVFRSEAQLNSRPASSASNRFATSDASRGFARAFAPIKKRLDPYESQNQQRSFSFSSAVPNVSGSASWDSYDPTTENQSETSRKSRRQDGQEFATRGRTDANDPRNKALEGTFGTTSVKRVTEENSEWLDLTLPDLNPDLEDPSLDIDPNVRANFLPISELYRAQSQRSASAMRNPTLVASNSGGSISTVIAGETITYTPKSGDKRLGELDRHGNYIAEYKGEIKKSLKRQYMVDVKERDRQMLQATAEYRALAAMSAEERADLLERLRKPYEWQGAFDEDQHDEPAIPEAYTGSIPTDRIMTWMEDDFSQISLASRRDTAPSTSGSASGRCEDSVDRDAPLGDFSGLNNFAAGSLFVPLEKPAPRTQQYFRDALHYGRKQDSRRPASQRSSSTVRTQTITQFDQARFNNAGTSPSVTASSRGLDDPFSFDDSPDFQFPDDCPIESGIRMMPKQQQFYKAAMAFSQEHGRVVLVHLHQLVKFTPGAIAKRVFSGIIQEMQLFPVQRVAIVIFLFPSEAKAFVRHVKKVHEHGTRNDIVSLQIEASWYK